jgi:hypothetical protein
VAGGLLEAAIILTGVALLLSHRGFRRTIAEAPSVLRWAVSGVLVVWFVSQIAEIETATYPLMSWHMYGESLRDAPIEGFRLQGVDCLGQTHRVPWSGGALGRRPHLAYAIPYAYRREVEAGPRTATGATTSDSLLLIVFAAWNRAGNRPPLCELHLQRIEVPAARASRAPLPPYATVRTVTGR